MVLTLPKAIIFDWDSTLAQTRATVVEALEKTLRHYQKEPWQNLKHLRQPLLSLKDNFPLIFGDISAEAYQYYLSVYKENTTTPTPFAREFLNLCLKKDITLYIVSNKERSLLLKEVELCYKNIPFVAILAHGDAEGNKPDAAPVFTALKNVPYAINPQNVWLVGDSLPDTECAYNANIQPIIVGHNIQDNSYLEQKRTATPPLIEVENFTELKKLINGL